MTKIRAVPRGYGDSMPDGHGVDQTVPEGFGLAFDFQAVSQSRPDQGGFRIPVHNETGKFAQKFRELSGEISSRRASEGVASAPS